MLISIIVPVLNIEKYIERCLESILAGCSDSCEIILVTGVSSDNSNEICERYQMAFPNVRVLQQSGKGLSNARNCALDVAVGEYVSYVDGDDYVDSELFRSLLETLRADRDEVDLIATDFRRISAINGRIENIYQIGEQKSPQKGLDFLPYMLQKKQCFWNVWRFIYRRSFLEGHGIRFLENRLSEDIDYTTKVLLQSPRTLFLHCPFYYYCVGRGDSLMDRPTYKRLQDTVDILCNSINLSELSSFVYSQLLIGQYQFEYILNIAITKEVPSEDRKRAYQLFRDTMDVLNKGKDPFSHFVRKLLHVLPISLFAGALYRLKMCKRFAKRSVRKMKVGGNN